MRELVITNKGRELMTKLIAGATTITFTKIKTTDEKLEADLENLEDFNVVKQEALISSVDRTDYTVVEILAMINNMGLERGYYINAVGLYAQDADKTEVLYGISVAGDHPDYMPAYGGKTVSTITYKLITKVDNSEQVNIEINPSALPTITQVNEIKNIIIETKELANMHGESKISDVDGVHGITFIEEEDTLRIIKQDGQVSNYKAGVDPDLLCSDLNIGLDNCIAKVGRTNE